MGYEMSSDEKTVKHETRHIHLDLLRVVACFGVIFSHVAASNWANQQVDSFSWEWFNIYFVLFRSSLPVFVMISGIFFLNPDKEIPLRKLYKKYVLRIVTAFLFWSISYAIIVPIGMIAFGRSDSINIFQVLKSIIVGEYHLWFLYMIIGIYMMVPLLKMITVTRKVIEYFLLLWLIFGITLTTVTSLPGLGQTEEIIRKFGMFMVMGYSGYFVLGYYLNKYKLIKKHEITIYILGILGLVSQIILTDIISSYYNKPNETFLAGLSLFGLPVAASAFVFFSQRISKISFSEKAAKLITYMSSCSFGMFLVHVFFINLFSVLGFKTTAFSPILSVPVISLVVFICCFVFIAILRKVKIFRKYIL